MASPPTRVYRPRVGALSPSLPSVPLPPDSAPKAARFVEFVEFILSAPGLLAVFARQMGDPVRTVGLLMASCSTLESIVGRSPGILALLGYVLEASQDRAPPRFHVGDLFLALAAEARGAAHESGLIGDGQATCAGVATRFGDAGEKKVLTTLIVDYVPFDTPEEVLAGLARYLGTKGVPTDEDYEDCVACLNMLVGRCKMTPDQVEPHPLAYTTPDSGAAP